MLAARPPNVPWPAAVAAEVRHLRPLGRLGQAAERDGLVHRGRQRERRALAQT